MFKILLQTLPIVNLFFKNLEKGDLVEKDILVQNMVSNLEIDAQKRVIFEIKSPFNLRLEPEFSTGSPVGEPNDLNLEPIIDELRELHRILYIPSTYGLDVHAEKTTTFN